MYDLVEQDHSCSARCRRSLHQWQQCVEVRELNCSKADDRRRVHPAPWDSTAPRRALGRVLSSYCLRAAQQCRRGVICRPAPLEVVKEQSLVFCGPMRSVSPPGLAVLRRPEASSPQTQAVPPTRVHSMDRGLSPLERCWTHPAPLFADTCVCSTTDAALDLFISPAQSLFRGQRTILFASAQVVPCARRKSRCACNRQLALTAEQSYCRSFSTTANQLSRKLRLRCGG